MIMQGSTSRTTPLFDAGPFAELVSFYTRGTNFFKLQRIVSERLDIVRVER